MPKGKKQVKTKETPTPRKQPKLAGDPQDYYHKNPAWRISKMEFGDPFGWHVLGTEKLDYIREKLRNFESMTWKEILVDAKKQNHNIAVDVLIKAARDRLTEIKLDDIDELTSLHLAGAERVWGILDQGILNLLWWDPDHKVCPSHKKNT
jgi:hypothetical protein